MSRVAGIFAASCGLMASTVLVAPAQATEPVDATVAATGDIRVCSLDASRSTRPLSAFGTLRTALTDPANFGAGGVVEATVTLAPPTPTATAADLAGCDVFFFADNPPIGSPPVQVAFSAAEVAAIADAVRAGMVLIGDADSNAFDDVNALAQALDGSSATSEARLCPDSAVGGVVGTGDNPATNGPFGDLRGDSFATSPSARITPATGQVATSCGGTSVRLVIPPDSLAEGSGLVMLGGDPSALDQFTSSTGLFYNPTNLALYLNAVAAAYTPVVEDPDPDPLADLLAKVTGVGPGTSLADKVTRAQDALAAGDTAGACDVLRAFVNQVDAISGKKVSGALAAELVADAEAVRELLGC